MNKKNVVIAGACALVIAGAAGCAKFTEPFNDAPVERRNDKPAVVYSMPDGFSNVSTKCDDYGNRIYVAYHGDNPYAAIAVVAQDPSCKK